MDKLDPSHEIDSGDGMKPENELPQPEGLDPEHELESGSENQRIGGSEKSDNSDNSENSEKSETHSLAETREMREGKETSSSGERMEKIEEDYKKNAETSGSGSSKMKLILASVFAIVASLAVLFYFFSDEIFRQDEELVPSVSPIVTPTPTIEVRVIPPMIVDTTGWKTYTNPEMNFSIQYPPTWKITPSKNPSESLVYQLDLTGSQGSIQLLWGSGFGGYCEDGWEKLSIANDTVDVCRYPQPDGSEMWGGFSKEFPGIASFTGMATINNPVLQNQGTVQTILSSMNFMSESPNQVACTMDAKLCPDGSSVGRSGPNCEFAPCPGN